MSFVASLRFVAQGAFADVTAAGCGGHMLRISVAPAQSRAAGDGDRVGYLIVYWYGSAAT